MNKYSYLICILLLISFSVSKQLSKMNDLQRKEILISESKNVMDEYGNEFYNGYKIVGYEKVTVEEFIMHNGNNKGEKVFVVRFFYKNMDGRELNFDQVYFWNKTGKPYSIQAGISTMGMFIKENLFKGDFK